MADLNHSTLTDEKLHQPKGASSASLNQVLTSNGDGTTRFADIPTQNLIQADGIETYSIIAQELAAIDNTLKIAFNPAGETSPGGSMTVAPDGTVTFNETGVYSLELSLSCSRTTNAGVTTLILNSEVNGTISNTSRAITLDSADESLSLGANFNGVFSVTAGDVLHFNLLRSTNGGGNAGLYPITVANVNFNDVPSAFLRLGKFEVA